MGNDRPTHEEKDADACARYLKALAEPIRLRIVQALQEQRMTVTELAQHLDLEIPNVSHHLRVLFHAELVKTERDGRFIYYEINQSLLESKTLKSTLDFGCCKLKLS